MTTLKRLLAFLLLPVLLLAQAPQVTVTTRVGAGRPLTFTEADANFTNLKNAVNSLNAKIISAKDFGAKGDGSTDDAAAINAGLAAINAAGGGRLHLSPGTYIIGSAIDYPGDNIAIDGAGAGHTIIKAKSGAAFENMITATNRTGIRLADLTVDANQVNRFTALQAYAGGPLRTVGVSWDSPVDGRIQGVIVRNTVGSGTIPGVGIGIGGAGYRNIISNCSAIDCGKSGYASDGFYTSGTQTIITGCVAKNCFDTGFVLEKSNYSGIVGSSADGCSAGAAITAVASDATGNFINGLTVNGWNSSVTGGVQIGALGSGNLLDTTIDGLLMTGGGAGPALNFRHISTGRIVGATVRARINGSSNQGILVDGTDNLTIASGTSINGTVSACIQVQTGCTKILVDGAQLHPTGPSTFGFTSTDGTDIVVRNCEINAVAGEMQYGIYFAGTGTRCYAHWNKVNVAGTARIGSDAGTIPNVVEPYGTGGFSLGKAGTTTLYDNAGILQTDNSFTSNGAIIAASTIKARGNLVESGPTGASSGNGGSFRTRNDTGVSSWLMGHLGSAGAVNWVLADSIAADYPITVVSGASGLMTFARPVSFTNSVKVSTVGNTLGIKEGTNAKMGLATLAAGSVVVSTTAVAANSRIFLDSQAGGGTPGWLRVSARTAGTSFTITSSSGTDTSTVAWVILDPL